MEEPGRTSGKAFSPVKERIAVWWWHARGTERLLPALICAALVLAGIYEALFAPPRDFSQKTIINIQEGRSLESTAQKLEGARVIRSATLLSGLLRLLGGQGRIKAGSYLFSSAPNLFEVALRLETGDFELKPVRVVVQEGDNSREIAAELDAALAPFDTQKFLAIAQPKEGHLFPDTYFFFPAQDPETVEVAMEHNYDVHISEIAPRIAAFGKPPEEDLIMASILVGEARTETDRRTVAGILWKRIAMGIPLQVDAPFGYIFNKNLTQLTSADLKVDSPYNTYRNKGLPPTPIGNPGLSALSATVNPIKTPYLFYLSDKQGNMHYSATYEEHLAQILRYLR